MRDRRAEASNTPARLAGAYSGGRAASGLSPRSATSSAPRRRVARRPQDDRDQTLARRHRLQDRSQDGRQPAGPGDRAAPPRSITRRLPGRLVRRRTAVEGHPGTGRNPPGTSSPSTDPRQTAQLARRPIPSCSATSLKDGMIRDMIEAPYRDRSARPENDSPARQKSPQRAPYCMRPVSWHSLSRLVWPIAARGDSSILAESDRGP